MDVKLIHLVVTACELFLPVVGTMDPGSVPLANQPSPRASMGPGPKVSRPRTVNRPINARVTLCLGARAPLISETSFSRCSQVPGCLFTRMFPFPIDDFTKQDCQPVLHDISICSPKNQSPRLQRNRKEFPTAARSRKRLYKKKNKSSFLK